MAVTWVPMPPDFFALPLRQMMLPLMAPLPVSSQRLAITKARNVTEAAAGRKRAFRPS
jgi:hypothetical protein